MISKYIFQGCWGLKVRSVSLMVHNSLLLTLEHDGTPEGEMQAVNNAMDSLEESGWQSIQSKAAPPFERSDFCWHYRSLTPSLSGRIDA
jgi:hypothetical protein